MLETIFSVKEVSDVRSKGFGSGTKSRFLRMVCSGAMILGICGGSAMAQDPPDNGGNNHHSTAEDFLRLGVRPVAIGHHGVGPNSSVNPDPSLPIENTVD